MNAALCRSCDMMQIGAYGMSTQKRSHNPIPDSIIGSETANNVLRELRLGLVSRAFVVSWIKELRGEGFHKLCDALEANL